MEKIKNSKEISLLLLPGAFQSPAARFRIWQFVEPMKNAGYKVSVRVPVPDRQGNGRDLYNNFWKKIPSRIQSLIRIIFACWILRNVKSFDYVITNRDIVPEIKVRWLEKLIIRKGVKLIFDFDDAIHLGPREKKLSEFLPKCYYITPGNEYLAEYAKKYNNKVMIIPTVVNTDKYKPLSSRPSGKIRIGWSGSSSTNIYCLLILKNIIEKLSEKYDFEFIVISNENPNLDWKGVQTRFIYWSPDTEISNLQLFDIGLMPLNDSPFERGKCGLKAIQYMALGIPAVVSPVGVNKEIVTHGEDGFHCYNEDDWIRCLETILNNQILIKEMGIKARNKIVSKYSVNYAMNIWQTILV